MTTHTRPAQFQTKQDPSMEKKWTQGSTPNQEVVCNWYLPTEKGKISFLPWSGTGYSFLFCLFWIIILFFAIVCFDLGGLFGFFLVFFLREEKERIEVGWVDRIWEKIREGEGYDQNLLNENVF